MIMCMIGATEIILICAVILLIFGGKKLPELMKGMGKGVKSFKEGMNEPTEEEIKRRVDEEVKRRADEKQRETDSAIEQSEITEK
jgi:twin arginine-targeting protein translocase, tatA/E family